MTGEHSKFEAVSEDDKLIDELQRSCAEGGRRGCGPVVGDLTKRELFAMAAMQAILTGAVTKGCPAHEWVDQDMAVKCADALLKELAK